MTLASLLHLSLFFVVIFVKKIPDFIGESVTPARVTPADHAAERGRRPREDGPRSSRPRTRFHPQPAEGAAGAARAARAFGRDAPTNQLPAARRLRTRTHVGGATRRACLSPRRGSSYF